MFWNWLSHWHNVWHLCISFDIKFNFRQKDRVIHLTLLSVRKRYRKYGIGKYLLQVCITLKTFWLTLVKLITEYQGNMNERERERERKRERDTCISNQSMENYFPIHSIYSNVSSNMLIYILFQQILEPEVVGHYDAIVVHADNGAVDFFQKFGFSDDIVLNSRWR